MVRHVVSGALIALTVSFSAHSQTVPPEKVFAMHELPPEVREVASKVLSYQIKVIGAASPDELTLTDLLKGRLATLLQAPGLNLSAADALVLRTYADEEKSLISNARASGMRRFSMLCDSRRHVGLSQVAQEVISLQADEDEQFNNYYKLVLSSLSNHGEQSVMDYLRTNVAPRMNKWNLDLARLAADMPDQFIAQLDFSCTAKAAAPTMIRIEGAREDGQPKFAPFAN